MPCPSKLSSVVACAHEIQKIFSSLFSSDISFHIARASDICRQLGISQVHTNMGGS